MTFDTPRTSSRRPMATLVAGAIGSVALALSMSGTLSSFSASIQNTTNTAATGSLGMQETLLDSSGNATSTTCSAAGPTSSTCSTINKYGGTTTGLTPGGAAQTTKISITNTGNVAATAFTLTPSACAATATSGSVYSGTATSSAVCGVIKVVITSGSTTVYSGYASGLSSGINLLTALNMSSIAAGATVPFTFTVSLDSSATSVDEGFTVSQPLTWTFNA